MKDKKKVTRRNLLSIAAGTMGAAALTACEIKGIGKDIVVDSQDVKNNTTVINSGYIIEPERSVPVLLETDVLVLGGGPSGLSAALASAAAGAKTTIVERHGHFGGVITNAQMGSISWYRHSGTVESNGMMKKFESAAEKMNSIIDVFGIVEGTPFVYILEKMGLAKDGKANYAIVDTEVFKHVADMMLLESGVQPILHCNVVDVIMQGNVIKGVITESKSGRQAILAKRVIDCTGDADVAARAGAPFRLSPVSEREIVTTNYGVSGANVIRFAMHLLYENKKMSDWAESIDGKEAKMFSTHEFSSFETAKAKGEIPKEADIRAFPGCFTNKGEILSLNAVHMHDIDGLDVMSLTEGEIRGRKQTIMAYEAMKKYAPGMGETRINNIDNLGIRESRKIIGQDSITEYDVLNQAKFNNSIGICPEFFDGYGKISLPTTGRYFTVPYGIMVPQQVENLLVAGRCVAGDRMSHAATRQMICCTVTGQGAGVAAAESLNQGTTCREVNIAKVQKSLKKQGVVIS